MGCKRGFTVIELVIVIAILGILAGIAIPRFLDAQATANGAKVLGNLRTLDSASTLFMMKNGRIPSITDLKNEKYIEIEQGYYQGEFKIKKNSGEEATYIDKGDYKINPEGRACLDNDAYTVDHYLNGSKSMGDYMMQISQLLDNSDNLFHMVDSNATDGDKTKMFNEALKNATGMDMKTLGATTWSYDGSDKRLYWSRADITNIADGTTIPVIRYNLQTGNYSVWNATVQTQSDDMGTYKVLSKPIVSAGYPSTGKTYEEAKAFYDNLINK